MSEAVCTKNHIRVWSKLTSLEWQLWGGEADIGQNRRSCIARSQQFYQSDSLRTSIVRDVARTEISK
jgi:hypothetical protein